MILTLNIYYNYYVRQSDKSFAFNQNDFSTPYGIVHRYIVWFHTQPENVISSSV